MVKLCVCMRACLLACLTACLTACMPAGLLAACLPACLTDCLPVLTQRQFALHSQYRKLQQQRRKLQRQQRKQHRRQQQLLQQQQQPEDKSIPSRARASRGPPGPLGVVLTSPPAVLGGPKKTGRGLPVLGEVKDSDVSIFSVLGLIYVLVLCDTTSSSLHELGLDLGLDSATLWTDKQTSQQHLSAHRQPEPAGADEPGPEREEGHSTSERHWSQWPLHGHQAS
jgi:hypothetical protein